MSDEKRKKDKDALDEYYNALPPEKRARLLELAKLVADTIQAEREHERGKEPH